MKLYVNKEVFRAEKIVKTDTAIIGYNGDSEVFSFKGINDFSKFILEEGQKLDIEVSEKERIEALELALLEVVLNG